MNAKPLPFPYVPTYVSGELLLSWIMRIHALNGNSDPRETLASLFGSATGIPSADLPCRLHRFVEATGSWGPFGTVESAASKASLFPYLARFLEPIRHHEALATLSGDQGGSLKVSIGLVANRFGASTLLRSCPVCASESIRTYGTTVLFRMHQLPGIGVCPLHGVPLRAHGIQSLQSNRQDLKIPKFGNDEWKRSPYASQPKSEIVMRLARLSLEALESEATPIPNRLRAETYLAQLSQVGLANGRKVDWPALAAALLREYDNFDGLDFKSRLMATQRNPLRWLKDLVGRPERALHPICHLTLIGYLFKDLRSYISATRAVATESGAAQRSPLNFPLGAKSHMPNSPLADIGLSCRTAARLAGVSVTTAATYRRAAGLPVSDRPKTVTKDVRQIAAQMLSSGASIPETCERTGISVSSVYRLMRWVPDVNVIRNNLRFESRVTQQRSAWLNIQRQFKSACCTELRERVPATYTWLYRHDREWLVRNSPPRVLRSRPPEFYDPNWAAVDADFSALIRRHYSQLLPLTSSKRVSAALLLRWTERPTTVRNNLHKLPLVSRAINELSESQADFKRRRIGYARGRLLAEGIEAPPNWRVLRLAGVRTIPQPKVRTSRPSVSSFKHLD